LALLNRAIWLKSIVNGGLFSIQGFSGEGVLISTVLKENDLGVK